MKSMSGKELAKQLEREGWILLRIQGSHHIYGKRGFSERLSVPIHGSKPMKTGLLRYLLKKAGLLENTIQPESTEEVEVNLEDNLTAENEP